MAPEPILVSACLLGRACRYDGCQAKPEPQAALAEALARIPNAEPVPFCPEEAGGLGTPRPAAWIQGQDAAAVLRGEARLVTEAGDDVTPGFLDGAQQALALARALGIKHALLKERSPSCGVRQTHIARQPADGPGVTAQLLENHGIRCEGI